MTIGSHVAEIARQGIWASLTGGWCYEPANSIFCNTIHLYTWSLLLITPLLIGIFSSGTLTINVFIGYVIFIVLFFAILKLIILYLHNVFDTTDPIIKYKTKKKTTTTDTTYKSPRSSFSGRAMSANDDIEMIDMNELSRRRNNEDENRQHSKRFEEDSEFQIFHNLKSIHEDDSSSSVSSKKSHNLLLETGDECHPKIAESYILPADSFELLPMAVQRNSSVTRKLSEPSFEAFTIKTKRRRGSTTSMRRVHSSSDAGHNFQRRSSAYYLRDPIKYSRRKSSPIFMNKTDDKLPKFDEQIIKTEKIVDDGQEPCCSKTIKNDDKKEIIKFEDTTESGVLRRIGQRDFPVEEIQGQPLEDLKGKITQFLEELIDKHPETLDVIESVRQNRLGTRTVDVDRDRPGPSNQINRLTRNRTVEQTGFTVANLKDGTHVAYDHEDTTEGAVHSFQDEHGTWWTYTFSDQGSGIAHPLGSTRAINELFNQRSSESPKTKTIKKTKHRRHASATGAVTLPETCSINSNHSGPSRIIKSAGTSRRSESLTDKQNVSSVMYIDPRTEDEIELGKVSDQNDSNNDISNTYVPTVTVLDEKRPKRRRKRRQRIHSSSSEEGGNQYISSLPTNVFHPNNIAPPMPITRQLMSLAQMAQRFTSNNQHHLVTQNNTIIFPSSSVHSNSLSTTSRGRTALERYADERRRRVLTVDNTTNERREYVRLQVDSDVNMDMDTNQASSLSSVNTMRIISELTPLGATGLRFTPRQSRVKANYYYRLKPFTLGKGLQVKLDRLSVAALFDRNNTIFSYFIDVILAGLVTILASLLISRGIYMDLSLVIFSFVVAGSQFSLLKSVQPDAASPVHGFNWLVTYSRPVYFIIISMLILLFDIWARNWNFNFFTKTKLMDINQFNNDNNNEMLLYTRDILSIILLLLPVAFTIGLLPQISTLLMHIFEQIDMILFGSTASFSLFSSFISLLRSITCIIILTLIGHFAYYFDQNSTQNTVYSAYISITVSISYIMSRWSSNTLFLNILFKELMPWNNNCISINNENENHDVIDDNIEIKNDKNQKETKSNEIEIETEKKDKNNLSIMGNFKTIDPLPEILKNTLKQRLNSDLFYFVMNSLIIFGIHCTSIFTATQPYFEIIISILCIIFSFINHYLYRKLRTHTPWKIFSKPIFKPYEFFLFESTVEAKLMLFEKIHLYMIVIEKNILYPLLLCSYMTRYGFELPIPSNYLPDPALSWFIVPITSICSFRIMRTAYSQPQNVYIPFIGSFVLSTFGIGIFQHPDLRPKLPEGVISSLWNSPRLYITPLIVLYFFIGIYPKIQELTLKLNFVLAYIAPWQISWGSAFHAFAQPFSLPHSGMILLQTIISSIISAPLNPFLGSSFFLMSYVRPVKFWEKDYNTKRVDHSNLRLISQIDRGPMIDDSNLNAIFYEHLTRSLQQSLAGDLQMGRWATNINSGDCFILASNYLNCLVHIIEIGNGFVTFQVRGLEFRGTYCHQREVEAISEDLNDSNGFCCCSLNSPSSILSLNNMFSLRWLAWEVTASKYIIDGYSITDNSAVNLLQVHELRRLLMSLYVKCIIYYALNNENFDKWIKNETIIKSLEPILLNERYVDTDQIFCAANDEDYDLNLMGITRQNFEELYGNWIKHCYERKLTKMNIDDINTYNIELINCFCYSLSLLGRRTLGTAAYNRHANAAESFLFGLHALFKGDLRITSNLDEWVFVDPDILTKVISPAVRMSLKLHQDHFAEADDFEQLSHLYDKIEVYQSILFISHEHDPGWRGAIISNIPSLLALRHMYDDGQDDYKIIMLNKMHLNMRVIKLNKECVRSFWSGQQQELIFLRNRNPERGSIQNARQVLRNMINSSADQPIGYPIYVSPLTTSFIETNKQVNHVYGNTITFCTIFNTIKKYFKRLKQHFGTSGSTNLPTIVTQNTRSNNIIVTSQGAGNTPISYRKRITTTIGQDKYEDTISIKTATSTSLIQQTQNIEKTNKNKKIYNVTDIQEEEKNERLSNDKDDTIKNTDDELHSKKLSTNSNLFDELYVEVVDENMILSKINEPLKSTNETVVVWPSEEMRKKGGKSAWPNNVEKGYKGIVVHIWRPFHENRLYRSHAGVIYLLKLYPKDHAESVPSDSFYVPILCEGVKEITQEEYLNSIVSSKNDISYPISENNSD